MTADQPPQEDCRMPENPPRLTLDEFMAGEQVELEALEMDVCGVCSAYVEDRDKHAAVMHDGRLQ